MKNDTSPPLAHIKVVELARILAGPWAGQILADLGATVTKVESPQGDDTRRWGPPFMQNADGSEDAAYFHACNRGKSSVCIDFSTSSGQQALITLIKEADVLIENFKVDGLKKYGLDYQSVQKINPKIIYCSITGFGQTGPLAHHAGYDFIVQGMSGMMDVTGEANAEPQKIGVAMADIVTGIYAVTAIQAALIKKERVGQGEYIDMALFDSMLGVLANQGMNYLATQRSPKRMGNAHPNIAPYETFAAQDGHFILAVGNDAQFLRFCDLWGLEAVAQDSRFSTNALRVKHRESLKKAINVVTVQHLVEDLVAQCATQHIPAAPILSIAQACEHPQTKAREMILSLTADDGCVFPGMRTPIRFATSTLQLQEPSPRLKKD